jgi:hypothetical protein
MLTFRRLLLRVPCSGPSDFFLKYLTGRFDQIFVLATTVVTANHLAQSTPVEYTALFPIAPSGLRLFF